MRRAVLTLLAVAACACGGGPTTPGQGNIDDQLIPGACGYSVRRGETNRSVPFSGGTVTVPVNASSNSSGVGCVWTVSVTDAAHDFITLVDPESGSSSAAQATVALTVAPNAGGQRQGVVRIADVPFTITEAGAPCVLTLGGDVDATFSASGGTGRVTIARTQGGGCGWTASSNSPFITNVAPASGADDGAVTFAVVANTGPARTGSLTIAGQTVSIRQSGVNVTAPSIASVAPASIAVGVPTTVTIGGTGFDPATVQLAVIGPACPETAPCIVPTAELTTRTPTVVAGPVTLRIAGAFTIQAQNGSGPLSNPVPILAIAGGAAPVVTSISPTQIVPGSASLTIAGSGFDASSVQVLVTGPACPASAPCIVTNAELTTRTATQIVAPVRLGTAGTFTIQVQNGPGGAISNGVPLTVVPPATPSITSVSPAQISAGVLTALTIVGANFDPATAQLAVVGPGCASSSPCIVTNGEMTSRSSTQLVAPVTLRTPGSYTIQVQNGSAGVLSNPASVSVR